MIIVDQSVIYTDNTLLQINVTPAEAYNLANAHSRPQHYRKDRIPMMILRMILQKINKQFLFSYGQCFSLLSLKIMGLL